MNKKSVDTTKITALSILVAVTAVLQTIAAVFPIKVFGLSVSLVMIPVAVAAYYYGYIGGAVVGGAFGVTVLVHCIIGLDSTGAMLFGINPFFTALATVARGVFAGLVTALVAKLLSNMRNKTAKYVFSSAVAPIANTGIFVVLFALLFNPTLQSFADADGKSAFSFLILTMVGINFLFELFTTVIITPAVFKALSKYIKK